MPRAVPSTPTPASPSATFRTKFSSPLVGSKHATTRTPFTTPCAAPPTPPDSQKRKMSAATTQSPLANTLSPGSSPIVDGSGTIDLSSLKNALPESPLCQRHRRKRTDSTSAQTGIALADSTPFSSLSSMPSLTFSEGTIPSASSSLLSDLNIAGSTAALPLSPSKDARTPNVYVNGLPPNFPEDQLFQMTREFGTVCSVRTFTRHVADRPSGYGFVLFETADAAERCIEGLRKYRNLHPSFSKQVHKIPGTAYASVPAASIRAVDADPSSFKAKMERLKDEGSTNLYMEGLPLSIDEPTLAQLVAPYTIKSSRFFQTKLSNPPRIIAFVRLETRAACEEVIERLHGRMVRGWKDAGSRISVRFADSNAQREMRRTERTNKDGDKASPAKLTMAQAALLNLHGAAPPATSPLLGVPTSLYPSSSLEPAHSAAISSQPVNMGSRLPAHPLVAPYQPPVTALQPTLPPAPSVANVDPHMAALLETLNGTSGAPTFDGVVPSLSHTAPSALRTQYNGFTPIEQQLIFQAQAQRQALLDAQRQALEVQQQMLALETQKAAQLAQETQARLQLQQQQSLANANTNAVKTNLSSGRPVANETFAPIDLLPPVMSEDSLHFAARATKPAPRTRTTTGNTVKVVPRAPIGAEYVHARSTTHSGLHRAHADTAEKVAGVQVSDASRAGSDDGVMVSPPGARSPASSVSSGTTIQSDVPSRINTTGPTQSSPASLSPALSFGSSARSSPSASSSATLSPMTPAFVPGQLPNAPISANSKPTVEQGPFVGLGVDMGNGTQ